MKTLLCFFCMLIYAPTIFGQVNLVRTGGTGYFLQTEAGDTLHLRGATPMYNQYHTALADAINYAGENLQRVFLRANIEDRVTADFGYYDVEIIEVEKPRPVYEFLNLELRTDTTGHHRLTSTAASAADSVHVNFTCIDNFDHTFTEYPDGVFLHIMQTRCTTGINMNYQFYQQGAISDTTKHIPAVFLTGELEDSTQTYFEDFSSPDSSEWELLWGDLQWSFDSGRMIVDLPERSQARVRWNRIPEHRNIRWRVIEEVHASHSTGLHIGGRVSPLDRGYAVENYIQGTGMGISLYHNQSWSNPVTHPLEWEYSQLIEYTIEIIDDTITFYHDNQAYSFSDEMISNTPDGYFAFGSTGAGLYILHEIEVEILDDL